MRMSQTNWSNKETDASRRIITAQLNFTNTRVVEKD